jgi:hypothetical protein
MKMKWSGAAALVVFASAAHAQCVVDSGLLYQSANSETGHVSQYNDGGIYSSIFGLSVLRTWRRLQGQLQAAGIPLPRMASSPDRASRLGAEEKTARSVARPRHPASRRDELPPETSHSPDIARWLGSGWNGQQRASDSRSFQRPRLP